MQTTLDLYAIQSKITKKYLSNLFEDSHDKTYQSKILDSRTCILWNNVYAAKRIAAMENGIVIMCKVVKGQIAYTAKYDGI